MVAPEYKPHFRDMTLPDLEAVCRIESAVHSHPWTPGKFSDSLKAGYQGQVMMLDDKVVAYALMMMVLDEAHLLNISVDAAYQKQGLGYLMLTHMVEKAVSLDALNMFLEVRGSNLAALHLYEKIGFLKTSIRRGYYPTNEGREDAILMGLEFKSIDE